MKENISIIIIGSGISGFTAAVKLIESGFSEVIVLEAGDRIGGRIHTTEFADGLIDLGAQWCHGIDGNIVHQLAGADSFAVTEMDFSRMTFAQSDGSDIYAESCGPLMNLCDKILLELSIETEGTVDELLTRKFLKSLELDEYRSIDRQLALKVLENFKKRESSYCGCESLTKINIEGYKVFKDCEGPTWLNWKGKGYKTIFDCVLKKSNLPQSDIEKKIHLKKEATSIDWSGKSKITVKCADGSSFQGDHVIVTVSLGVLKQSHAALFTPELPIHKRKAIEETPFGAVGKIFLRFSEKFWPDDWVGISLLWTNDDLEDVEGTEHAWFSNIYCFYTVDCLPNVLLGRLAGDKISQMESQSDENIINDCEFIFKKFLMKDVAGTIIDVKTSKWKSNKLFQGTYSYHSNKDSSTQFLSEPLCSSEGKLRVQFAGEATHECFASTVHGAIESGMREADRIVKLYA